MFKIQNQLISATEQTSFKLRSFFRCTINHTLYFDFEICLCAIKVYIMAYARKARTKQ